MSEYHTFSIHLTPAELDRITLALTASGGDASAISGFILGAALDRARDVLAVLDYDELPDTEPE